MKRILCAFLVLASVAFAAGPFDPPRGGRVGWARLITESSSWSVHAGNDPLLAHFIRTETSLNIDPAVYPVDPAHLDALCAYPLIFTNNLTNVHDPRNLANLREYLQRGGFIYVDRCVNLSYSLEQETFYERHLEFFARLLPDSIVRELKDDHPINRAYFTTTPPPRSNTAHNHGGLYGVFENGRMVILLSNANLQCGWPNSPGRAAYDMKMVANIYVYAMTRAEESGMPRPP